MDLDRSRRRDVELEVAPWPRSSKVFLLARRVQPLPLCPDWLPEEEPAQLFADWKLAREWMTIRLARGHSGGMEQVMMTHQSSVNDQVRIQYSS